ESVVRQRRRSASERRIATRGCRHSETHAEQSRGRRKGCTGRKCLWNSTLRLRNGAWAQTAPLLPLHHVKWLDHRPRWRGAFAVDDHTPTGGIMNFLVMLEEGSEKSPVLARVDSIPAQLSSARRARDVVTLYGTPRAELLALAIAAALESRSGDDDDGAFRHLGVWPERGAVGDAAWRDESTG